MLALAALFNETAGDIRTDGTLIGSVDGIVEQLQRRYERYGVNYYVVQGRAMEQFASVVARLT